MCSACSGDYENPEMTQYGDDREATESEVSQAIEQEQILEASRSVRRGDFMLFAALRQNGVMK